MRPHRFKFSRITYGFDVSERTRNERKFVVIHTENGNTVRHIEVGARKVRRQLRRRLDPEPFKFFCALLPYARQIFKFHFS